MKIWRIQIISPKHEIIINVDLENIDLERILLLIADILETLAMCWVLC